MKTSRRLDQDEESRRPIGQFHDQSRGPIYMVGAGFIFVIMLCLVKVARQELAAVELMFWRGAISLPLAALISIGHRLELGNVRTLSLRCSFGFLGMLGSYHAAKGLSVADLNILGKLQPIFVAIFAPLFLGPKEKASHSLRWIIVFGLVGGTLIIGPDLAFGSTYGLWALAATFASAAAHLSIRGAIRTSTPGIVVMAFQATVLVLSAIWITIDPQLDFHVLPTQWWPYIAGIGVTSTIGQLLLTHAYRYDRAPTVAAAGYVTPIWGMLADILIFATLPDVWVLLGGALVVGAGIKLVYTTSRDNRLNRDATASGANAEPNANAEAQPPSGRPHSN